MDYHKLEGMTVVQLRDELKKFPDVKISSGTKKDEMLDLLVEKLGIEKPEKKAKSSKAAKTHMDKASIKAKVAALRQEWDSAREAKDKKKANLLRKRIHSLKRRMHKAA